MWPVLWPSSTVIERAPSHFLVQLTHYIVPHGGSLAGTHQAAREYRVPTDSPCHCRPHVRLERIGRPETLLSHYSGLLTYMLFKCRCSCSCSWAVLIPPFSYPLMPVICDGYFRQYVLIFWWALNRSYRNAFLSKSTVHIVQAIRCLGAAFSSWIVFFPREKYL